MSNANNSLWSQEYIWRKLGYYMEKYEKNLRNREKTEVTAEKMRKCGVKYVNIA